MVAEAIRHGSHVLSGGRLSVSASKSCPSASVNERAAASRVRPCLSLGLSLALRRQSAVSGLTLPRRILRRNEFLYVHGEPGETLFMIESGWLKRVVPTMSGRNPLIDIHGWGDLIGEASLSDNMRHDSIIALSDCRVLVVSMEILHRLLQAGELTADWTRHICDRIRWHQDVIAQFITMDSRQRLSARLAMLGQRLIHDDEGVVELPRGLTQEDLAAIVGTTRSRIGVFLRALEDDGLIVRSGGALCYEPTSLGAALTS